MTALKMSLDDIPKSQRDALERAIDRGYTNARLVGEATSKSKGRLRVFVQVQAPKSLKYKVVSTGEVEEEVWLFVDDAAAPWNKINT